LDNAIYVLHSLEQYRTEHPKYATRRDQIKESSYQWIWIVAESILHNKSLAHYGACIIPTAMIPTICAENRLGDYSVQRRWNLEMRSFEYCVSLDPCNRHYYSWWRTNLEGRGDLQEFLTLVNLGQNMEMWGDIVEAALGILIIADRVPELEAYLTKQFLPEGVEGWQVLHSLSDSIRNFQGWRDGSISKRKKKTCPPPIPNTRWTVTFNPRYSTPTWEFLKPSGERTEPLTRRPDLSLGTEPLSTILCVAGLGAQLINCRCPPCVVLRRLMAMNNPQMRSVMSRREEQPFSFTPEQYADFQVLVEQAMQRIEVQEPVKDLPQEAGSSNEPPRAEGVDHRSHPQSSVSLDVVSPKEVEGVSLRELFISLRGHQGERGRDTTTKYDSK
jgi:hypothetical protein